MGSNMDKIYIVMNYVEHDLKSLMETMKQPFLPGRRLGGPAAGSCFPACGTLAHVAWDLLTLGLPQALGAVSLGLEGAL